MINVKNVLGKLATEVAVKDAVHTAIVSVRAACCINPGAKCGLNEFNEAIPSEKGYGVADPFLKNIIKTGDIFWLVLGQSEIPNVQHVWEHPKTRFDPPTRDVKLNKYILEFANQIGVTYKELMDAAEHLVNTGRSTKYPGNKTEEDIEKLWDRYGFWSEWTGEVGHDFENIGSTCCPEYDYPSMPFYFE